MEIKLEYSCLLPNKNKIPLINITDTAAINPDRSDAMISKIKRKGFQNIDY